MPKLSYLGIFVLEFERTVVVLEISTLKFVKVQSFMENKETLSLGPKMPYFGTFRQKFENTIFILENSTFEFFC